MRKIAVLPHLIDAVIARAAGEEIVLVGTADAASGDAVMDVKTIVRSLPAPVVEYVDPMSRVPRSKGERKRNRKERWT